MTTSWTSSGRRGETSISTPRPALRSGLGGRNTGPCLYDSAAAAFIFDVPTAPPTSPLVVLLAGDDVRVLGVSVRTRNARVASRVGATVVDVAALDGYGDTPAIAVPPNALIETGLFPLPHLSAPARLAIDDARRHDSKKPGSRNPEAVAGSARDLPCCITDKDALAHLPSVLVAPTALLDVSSAAARRESAWRILRRTVKPTDGWISRHWNRPISRVVSFVLLSAGLEASHASALTLLVGLVAAVIGAQPGYLALAMSGVLFHFASVLDGVDGEMARATLTESEAGARLDALVDQLTYVGCFVGVTVGWAREGRGSEVIGWTMAIALALVLTLVRGGRFVAQYAPDASFVFIDRTVRRAGRGSRRAGLRLAPGVFTLLRRDLFAVIFLVIALTGLRVLIPALVAAGILAANATLSIYRRELAEAAIAEREAMG